MKHTTEPPQSVMNTVAAACVLEGTTLEAMRENWRANGDIRVSPHWARVFGRVIARVRRGPAAPSLPELGSLFGCSHSTIYSANQRGCESLDAEAQLALLDRHGHEGLIEIGKAVVSGLRVHKPSRPLYDDGESNG